jgi:hypothetical protein
VAGHRGRTTNAQSVKCQWPPPLPDLADIVFVLPQPMGIPAAGRLQQDNRDQVPLSEHGADLRIPAQPWHCWLSSFTLVGRGPFFRMIEGGRGRESGPLGMVLEGHKERRRAVPGGNRRDGQKKFVGLHSAAGGNKEALFPLPKHRRQNGESQREGDSLPAPSIPPVSPIPDNLSALRFFLPSSVVAAAAAGLSSNRPL